MASGSAEKRERPAITKADPQEATTPERYIAFALPFETCFSESLSTESEMIGINRTRDPIPAGRALARVVWPSLTPRNRIPRDTPTR